MRSLSSVQWNPLVPRGALGCTPPSVWVISWASTLPPQHPASIRAYPVSVLFRLSWLFLASTYMLPIPHSRRVSIHTTYLRSLLVSPWLLRLLMVLGKLVAAAAGSFTTLMFTLQSGFVTALRLLVPPVWPAERT